MTIHRLLCIRQCNVLEKPITDKQHFDYCLNPPLPNRSIYSHCDKAFQFDFYQRGTCKKDICNLCCLSFRFSRNHSPTKNLEMAKVNISKEVFQNCQKECTSSKLQNILTYKQNIKY